MAAGSRKGKEWNAIRLQCLERDGYICAYCGNEANEADHIIAVANGGKDVLSNLVAACKPCNGRKSDKQIIRMTYFNRDWLSSV